MIDSTQLTEGTIIAAIPGVENTQNRTEESLMFHPLTEQKKNKRTSDVITSNYSDTESVIDKVDEEDRDDEDQPNCSANDVEGDNNLDNILAQLGYQPRGITNRPSAAKRYSSNKPKLSTDGKDAAASTVVDNSTHAQHAESSSASGSKPSAAKETHINTTTSKKTEASASPATASKKAATGKDRGRARRPS